MKILKIIKTFFKEIRDNHISEYTASCAYYTILAFIPFLILLLTLTKYTGLDKEIISLTLGNYLPDNLINNTATQIIKEVYSKSIGTITISALFVLWSAGKGFFALCKGINAVYGVKNNKYLIFRIKGLICTIIFIVIVILALIILVFGNRINTLIQTKLNIFNDIFNILMKCKILIGLVMLTGLFVLMYRFIPKCKNKIKYQILGAIFAAISCNVISIFYSIYVNKYNGFSIMYGSLNMVAFAMMWTYACMYCILIGALINKNVEQYFNNNHHNAKKI